jgi:hypothetical protein
MSSKLKVFESEALRGKFGSKRHDVTGGPRKYTVRVLIIFILQQILCKGNEVRSMRWVEHVAILIMMTDAHTILVGKLEKSDYLAGIGANAGKLK